MPRLTNDRWHISFHAFVNMRKPGRLVQFLNGIGDPARIVRVPCIAFHWFMVNDRSIWSMMPSLQQYRNTDFRIETMYFVYIQTTLIIPVHRWNSQGRSPGSGGRENTNVLDWARTPSCAGRTRDGWRYKAGNGFGILPLVCPAPQSGNLKQDCCCLCGRGLASEVCTDHYYRHHGSPWQ